MAYLRGLGTCRGDLWSKSMPQGSRFRRFRSWSLGLGGLGGLAWAFLSFASSMAVVPGAGSIGHGRPEKIWSSATKSPWAGGLESMSSKSASAGLASASEQTLAEAGKLNLTRTALGQPALKTPSLPHPNSTPSTRQSQEAKLEAKVPLTASGGAHRACEVAKFKSGLGFRV